MRKGALNILGRKNQSLFDTNIKIKDMDNVELVLQSSAIPESGTASVRARPTVKHHSSSSLESFQGFAVPTPKVPVLPPLNGPKINGSVNGDNLSIGSGSVISVPDLVEGEIFVPPPPSMAPPPPPVNFIPPPPDFMDGLNSSALANLQPPPMPAPKLPLLGEEDLGSLKLPPMAPPKPPSTCSSGSASSISMASTPPTKIPEHPKFAPPQPPSERPHKTPKTPPPKPIRLSSISTLDSPPQTPAPPPPVQTPSRSTFNPQNTAKLYNIPKPSILSGYDDPGTRPKQILLLEDSGSVKSTPVLVQVDGKAPKAASLPRPVSKDLKELKENKHITQPSPPPLSEPKKEAITGTVSAPTETNKPPQTLHQTSPRLHEVNNSEPSKGKQEGSPSQGHKFSPLLDHKLRNLKSSETNGPRDGPVASPLALLMAAKERDKYRSMHSLSRENSNNKNEQPCSSIQPSDSSRNSFIVTPRSSSSSSLPSQDLKQDSPTSVRPVEQTPTIHTPQKSSSPALVKHQMPFASPAPNSKAISLSATNVAVHQEKGDQSPSKSQPAEPLDNSEELSMPLLPPPPEFEDLDEMMEPPPSIRPPDPPMKKAPTPSSGLFLRAQVPTSPQVQVQPSSQAQVPPAPQNQVPPSPQPQVRHPPQAQAPPPSQPHVPHPPQAQVPPPPQLQVPPVSQAQVPPAPSTPTPPAAPKPPPLNAHVKPKPLVQKKTKVAAPPQIPTSLSPSQVTLLSILQKKMLEMDNKMATEKEPELGSDDWGNPLSDEDNKVPVVTRSTPQKNYPVFNKAATLDMRELENRVAKKHQETSSVKIPTSNGVQSKQYGMTFTVRPGTKNPITFGKGES